MKTKNTEIAEELILLNRSIDRYLLSHWFFIGIGAIIFIVNNAYPDSLLHNVTNQFFFYYFLVFTIYCMIINFILLFSHRINKINPSTAQQIKKCKKLFFIFRLIDSFFLFCLFLFVSGHDSIMILFLILIPVCASLQFYKNIINQVIIYLPIVYLLSVLSDVFILKNKPNYESIIFTVIVLFSLLTILKLINIHKNNLHNKIKSSLAKQYKMNLDYEKLQNQIHHEIEAKSHKIQDNYLNFLSTIIMIMEKKDPIAFGSSVETNNLAIRIAQEIGDKKTIKLLQTAGVLHDIGNIGIPDMIFYTEQKLGKNELKLMKEHVTYAEKILSSIDYFKEFIPLCKYHHESYNGKGYPEGLIGESIPIEARILAVADSYTSLISPRYFRNAYSREEAMKIIDSVTGIKFDPKIVAALKRVLAYGYY